MPLPRKLMPVAEALADAAYIICEQAGWCSDEDTGGGRIGAASAASI